MAERLIRTEYSGSAGDRMGHACTLEGALRAAIIRLAHGEYTGARVYDLRFGEKAGARPALTLTRSRTGIALTWTSPKWRAE